MADNENGRPARGGHVSSTANEVFVGTVSRLDTLAEVVSR